MSDLTAKTERLMRATDAVMEELDRQGVAEVMSALKFDPIQTAQAVIRVTDGDVIQFPCRQYPPSATSGATRSCCC
jgi:hypothetical protein